MTYYPDAPSKSKTYYPSCWLCSCQIPFSHCPLRVSLPKGAALPDSMSLQWVAYIWRLLWYLRMTANPSWSNSGQLRRAISSSESPLPGSAEDSIEAALRHDISRFPILLPSLPFHVHGFQTHSIQTHLQANFHIRLVCFFGGNQPAIHFLLWVTASGTHPVLLPCPSFPIVGLVIEVFLPGCPNWSVLFSSVLPS